ncbi:MAG TPA: helix-turn-helix transcriptional regulator [Mycobacterium sp.]|nr:helix-turn-helix transcriptional regulator [Mycobacterium sp.]
MGHLDEVIRITTTDTNSIARPERSRVEISDASDADQYLEDIYGVRLRLRRVRAMPHEGPLLMHSRTAVGPFAVEDGYLAGDVAASPDPLNRVVAVWVSSGRVSGYCAGVTGEAAPGEVALVSQPDLPHRSYTHDLEATTLLLDPAVVAGVASGLPLGQAPRQVRFTSFQPVDAAAGRLWTDTVSYVAGIVLRDDAVVTPLVVGHASRLLAAVMLSTFANASGPAPSPHDRTDGKPLLLRRAMEFMDANAANDIAITDIAEAIHVTPRAVQYMFRRHLDTTPLQYLRRMRLHLAHLELSAADRMHDTVTEIAARWGFAHTGRFAVLYRQTYGQSPHTTLRD